MRTLSSALRGLKQSSSDRALALVRSVRIASGQLNITLDAAALAADLGLATGDLATACLQFACGFQTRRRGVETKVVAGKALPAPDPTLRRTLAMAHRWIADLRKGHGLNEIAAEQGHADSYIRTRAPLAFLSPKIQSAILNGTQPPDLTTERLARTSIPLGWGEQEALFGFA